MPLVWTRFEPGDLGLQDDVASAPDLVGKAIGRLPTADKRDVVSDSGFGMQNKVRERAFDLFEKFDSAGMDFAQGIGLGLPISRKLMVVPNSMTISAPV